MKATHFVFRRAEAIEHLLAGYRIEADAKRPTLQQTAVDHFTIALAREAGTPALEVAREVGERLGWPAYDRELPARIAQELHVPVSAVEALDERQPSWLLECIESFSLRCELSEGRYFRHLVSLIRSLGQEGRSIFVGHGAAFLLPWHSTLRVCLVGDREDRIATLSRRLHIDRETAARQIDEIEGGRTRFLRTHFHLDPTQPRNYDLVLNCSQWSPPDCAEIILRALHKKASGHLSG
jgi:hypothetical protein